MIPIIVCDEIADFGLLLGFEWDCAVVTCTL